VPDVEGVVSATAVGSSSRTSSSRYQFRQINALKSQTVLAVEIVYDAKFSTKTSCPNSNIS